MAEYDSSANAGNQRKSESPLKPVAVALVLLSVALAWGLQNVGDGIARRGGDTVSVRGQAVRNVKADRAVWKLSVSQSADNAAAAIEGLQVGVDVVLSYLKKNATPDDAITLGGVGSFANKEFKIGRAHV